MLTEINLLYPLLATLASFALAVVVSAHVVLYKRDVRAAIGWVGMIWLTPFIGSFLYVALGINRVSRKARKFYVSPPPKGRPTLPVVADDKAIDQQLGEHHQHLKSLVEYVNKLSDERLLCGNRIVPMDTGDAAYECMLQAIDRAQHSIALSTYIFDNDAAGKMFVEALSAARQRGVEVRVLIDDVGVRYTFPSVKRLLRRADIKHATFFPTLIPWKFHYSNLRNHRKLLITDGKLGFTGGMNIRSGHLSSAESHPIQDMHFRVEGPVVRHLQETFANDWEFVTGEHLESDTWFPNIAPTGEGLARGIAAGPDQHGDRIRLTLMGALACAQRSVTIVTPYFLPDAGLIHALNTADLRGVNVQIVLPEQNNLRLVQWASTAMLWQVLERGVQVWLSPPPFDHTKLMIVDELWSLTGSANWDPRSLRLNFEFNLECYDPQLAGDLTRRVNQKIAASKSVSLKDVDGRPLLMRVRDGFARLLMPYL